MWKWFFCALVGVIAGCGTGIDNITKQACVGVGFSADQVAQIKAEIASWPSQGITFEEATLFVIKIARDACGDTEDCLAARGCLELAVQSAYHKDQNDQTVTLALKMPLPGGKSWLLTTEAGGGDCASSVVDVNHTGKNYYSLDFDDISSANGVVKQEHDVAVYAVAPGKIFFAGNDTYNGNYVVVEMSNGYSARYLHLRDFPTLTKGTTISAGQQLGIVGSTGTYSTGTHIHIGIRYNDSGASDIAELGTVTMEGLPLKSYKTSCSGPGQRNGFYLSSNTRS